MTPSPFKYHPKTNTQGGPLLRGKVKGKSGPVFDYMRNILESVGINIDSYHNGFLTGDAAHLGTHTEEFFDYLYKLLSKAKTREQVEAALNAARKKVSKGVFG
jgi:hypothetical protein